MPHEIVWLPAAVRDVMRLRDFIRTKNPAAARRAAIRIKEAIEILTNNPAAGRPVEDLLPFRDLFIAFGAGNYVLRYREDDTRIVVVRIWHSREER